ncbi:hypothetical protein [Nocardia sp. NPDC048505]|uniref:hypothetical protein n=1 Tax=unclassified Nocardia TaxID=2637762 RepID=UPI0033FB54B5
MRQPAEVAARLRGALVGSASGAVSIAAHALGGGMVSPGDSSIVLLLGACAVVGVVVGALRERTGFAELVLLLAAGQAIGHTALTLAPCHQPGSHADGPMLLAHVLAIPLGALLIRAAEAGLARAASSVRCVVHALRTRPTAHRAATSIAVDPAIRVARRFLLSSGPGTRGPPAFA